MTEFLGIEVVNLKRAMVHVAGWVGAHEKGMVVNMVASSVDVSKNGHILFLSFGIHI